ncbi:MAG: DUF4382 domain-containing protein [Candidatus Micrarchaeia archaeon]
MSFVLSTVSQHNKEFDDSVNSNEVRKKSNPQSRKRDEPNTNEKTFLTSSRIGKTSISVAIALLALLGIAYYFSNIPLVATLVYLNPNGSISQGATVFSISDAPALYNITSLEIQINNIEVHSTTTGRWYDIEVSKVFNLVNLDNISEIIAGTKLPDGTYNLVVMNIGGANATINGKNESVFVPSKKLRLDDTFNITNNSTNLVNFDFNLEYSLHITENGEIIMAPVINVGHYHGRSIVFKNYMFKGVVFRHSMLFGMNENGTMIYNETMRYWIEARNGKLVSSNAVPVVIVKEPHMLSILINSDPMPNVTNVTINGNNMSCIVKNNKLIVCAGKSLINPLNIPGEVWNSTGIINQSTLLNKIIISNPISSLLRIKVFYPNASENMFYCNTTSECLIVPLTICQNNLPTQSTCINSNYYQEYMFYYDKMRSHTMIMCPMFIMQGRSNCACIDNTCTLEYNGPIIIPEK